MKDKDTLAENVRMYNCRVCLLCYIRLQFALLTSISLRLRLVTANVGPDNSS